MLHWPFYHFLSNMKLCPVLQQGRPQRGAGQGQGRRERGERQQEGGGEGRARQGGYVADDSILTFFCVLPKLGCRPTFATNLVVTSGRMCFVKLQKLSCYPPVKVEMCVTGCHPIFWSCLCTDSVMRFFQFFSRIIFLRAPDFPINVILNYFTQPCKDIRTRCTTDVIIGANLQPVINLDSRSRKKRCTPVSATPEESLPPVTR